MTTQLIDEVMLFWKIPYPKSRKNHESVRQNDVFQEFEVGDIFFEIQCNKGALSRFVKRSEDIRAELHAMDDLIELLNKRLREAVEEDDRRYISELLAYVVRLNNLVKRVKEFPME